MRERVDDLKPCPCGAKVYLYSEIYDCQSPIYTIECPACLLALYGAENHRSEDAMVAAWNNHPMHKAENNK